MIIISRTQYLYVCSIGSGKAIQVHLIHYDNTYKLWLEGTPIEVSGQEEAEKILCEKYQEVMLESKSFITTRKEEIIIK